MKKKISVVLLASAMLLSGAIYAGNFFVEKQVDTDCEFTGSSSQSCSYRTGGVNYRVLNCVPNGSDCAFDLPSTTLEP